MPLSRMGSDAVEVLRDRKIDLPGAANNRVKAIRQVFKFGSAKEHTRTARLIRVAITLPATLRNSNMAQPDSTVGPRRKLDNSRNVIR